MNFRLEVKGGKDETKYVTTSESHENTKTKNIPVY